MGKNKENKEIEGVVSAVLAAICKSEETAAPETDLGGRDKYIVSTFTNGYLDFRHEAESKDDARAWLQRPENLGKTIVISKEIACLTTAIPLVDVTDEEEGA